MTIVYYKNKIMKTRHNIYLTQLKFGLFVCLLLTPIMFITEQCEAGRRKPKKEKTEPGYHYRPGPDKPGVNFPKHRKGLTHKNKALLFVAFSAGYAIISTIRNNED